MVNSDPGIIHVFPPSQSSIHDSLKRLERFKGTLNEPKDVKGTFNEPKNVKGTLHKPQRVEGILGKQQDVFQRNNVPAFLRNTTCLKTTF